MATTATATISTDAGDYLIWQATEDMRHADGDIKAGDWLYQPTEWDGDIYSLSYATREEAEQAAIADGEQLAS